jgi:hypothetical protein
MVNYPTPYKEKEFEYLKKAILKTTMEKHLKLKP